MAKTASNSQSPRVDYEGQKELKRIEEAGENFHKDIVGMNLRNLENVPKHDEPSKYEVGNRASKKPAIQLRPARVFVHPTAVINEKFRPEINFASERVRFIAENKESDGDTIELWTNPYVGMPCEFWQVPVGVVVEAPRYVAENIVSCTYTQFIIQEDKGSRGSDNYAHYTGVAEAKFTKSRLDAVPAVERSTLFLSTGS